MLLAARDAQEAAAPRRQFRAHEQCRIKKPPCFAENVRNLGFEAAG